MSRARDARGRFVKAETLPDTLDAVRADLDALLAIAPHVYAEANPASLAQAQARFARRALSTAAEHGIALLAALDVPFPVGPEFEQLDGAAISDAVDLAIAALDALDGDPEAEPFLGAAENHPGRWHVDMDGRSHTSRGRRHLGNQTYWSAGYDREDNGDEHESEAGYDLPEGDDERDDDGLTNGEGDESEHEQNLGSPAGDGNQEHWAQGDSRDYEDVNEGGGGQYDPAWYERPIGPVRPLDRGYDHDSDMRALSREAQAVRRSIKGAQPQRDPDLLSFVGMPPGTAIWRPYTRRDDVPVVGQATA